jgi:hypothetical protein
MNALVMIVLMLLPFAALGAVLAVLIVRIGNETAGQRK